MTVLPITIWGEPVLHRRAAEVEVFDDELRTLIADMFETNDAANGVGLAAPQVGVGKRLFVYKFDNDDGAPPSGVVVNPVLTLSKVSGALPDPDEEEEGCLSFPGGQYPLKRAEWARVQGFDGDGNPVDFEATGWFARVVQHEYDHLDGKLYVNRLIDRYARKAMKLAKRSGWGVPGLTWMPAWIRTRSGTRVLHLGPGSDPAHGPPVDGGKDRRAQFSGPGELRPVPGGKVHVVDVADAPEFRHVRVAAGDHFDEH